MNRRTVALILVAGGVASIPSISRAQDASPAELSAANCAPSAGAAPAGALRVVGGQADEARSIFGPRDLVIVGGGTSQGLQLGQQFFVRRSADRNMRKTSGIHAVNTAGGLRIVALNETTAIATIDFVCDTIMTSDYLVPYVQPTVPPDTARSDTTGELDFSSVGHIIIGDGDRSTGSKDGFMVADVGTGRGAVPGMRFAVYRDTGVAGTPVQAVGEAIVVSAEPDTSIVQLTLTRDAIRVGDLLVPRRRP